MLLNSTSAQMGASSDWKNHFLAAVSARVEARDGIDSQTGLLSAKVALVQADAELRNPELKGSALLFASFQKQNAVRNLTNAMLSAETPKSKLDPKLTGRARILAAFEAENVRNPECCRYSSKNSL